MHSAKADNYYQGRKLLCEFPVGANVTDSNGVSIDLDFSEPPSVSLACEHGLLLNIGIRSFTKGGTPVTPTEPQGGSIPIVSHHVPVCSMVEVKTGFGKSSVCLLYADFDEATVVRAPRVMAGDSESFQKCQVELEGYATSYLKTIQNNGPLGLSKHDEGDNVHMILLPDVLSRPHAVLGRPNDISGITADRINSFLSNLWDSDTSIARCSTRDFHGFEPKGGRHLSMKFEKPTVTLLCQCAVMLHFTVTLTEITSDNVPGNGGDVYQDRWQDISLIVDISASSNTEICIKPESARSVKLHGSELNSVFGISVHLLVEAYFKFKVAAQLKYLFFSSQSDPGGTDPAPTGRTESVPTDTADPSPNGSTEPVSTGTADPAPAGSTEPVLTEPAPSGCTEPVPTGIAEPVPTEPAPSGSSESASVPAGSTDPAPAGRTESVPTDTADPAPTGSTDPAPAGSTEPVPTGTAEPAPSGSTEPASVPSGSTDPAPAGRTEPVPTGTGDPVSTSVYTGSTEPVPTETTDQVASASGPQPVANIWGPTLQPIPDSVAVNVVDNSQTIMKALDVFIAVSQKSINERIRQILNAQSSSGELRTVQAQDVVINEIREVTVRLLAGASEASGSEHLAQSNTTHTKKPTACWAIVSVDVIEARLTGSATDTFEWARTSSSPADCQLTFEVEVKVGLDPTGDSPKPVVYLDLQNARIALEHSPRAEEKYKDPVKHMAHKMLAKHIKSDYFPQLLTHGIYVFANAEGGESVSQEPIIPLEHQGQLILLILRMLGGEAPLNNFGTHAAAHCVQG